MWVRYPSQHLTVHLPRRVPVGDRYSLLDLYFACAIMELNMKAFFDDYKIFDWSTSLAWGMFSGERSCYMKHLALSLLLAAHECTCSGQKGTASRVCSKDVLFIVKKVATSLWFIAMEILSCWQLGSSDVSARCESHCRFIRFAFDTFWLELRLLTDSWVRSPQQADSWIWPLLGLVQWVIRIWRHSMMLTGRRILAWMNVTQVPR